MNEDFEDVFNYFISGFRREPMFATIDFAELEKARKERVKKENEVMRNKPHHSKNCHGDRKAISNVIFENKHCIIIDNFGNKYIAKPEKGERFDKEKGFLVALAKYNGFTTTKCQELIKKAVDKDEKKAKKQNKSNGNKKQPKKN